MWLQRVVLSSLPLSSNIASALASPLDKDISTVVAALQMVHLLLEVRVFEKKANCYNIDK